MCADVESVRNLFIRQRALVLDRARRVEDCMFQARIRGVTELEYGATRDGND